MNPTTAQNLDPKLKETYDRIMGTQINVQSRPQSQAPTPPQAPIEHAPISAPAPASNATADQEVEMVNVNSTAPITKVEKAKGKISPVIFVVVGVGFFLLYTTVWLKVFKIF